MTDKGLDIEPRVERFAPGDLVRLRSGSPSMPVLRCADGRVDLIYWSEDEVHKRIGLPAAAPQRLGEEGPFPDK